VSVYGTVETGDATFQGAGAHGKQEEVPTGPDSTT